MYEVAVSAQDVLVVLLPLAVVDKVVAAQTVDGVVEGGLEHRTWLNEIFETGLS